MKKRTKFAFLRPYIELLYKKGTLGAAAYKAIILILDDEDEREE